ncbi:MAG: AbrB/MazE/SpoVT family DNA-binding domain-containing protein [Bacillota bacterium]
MKSTGIVRRLDDLGRFVVPIELRRTLGMEEGTPLEVYTQGDTILLRRYEPFCTFCGHGGTMVTYHGKHICQRCLSTLSKSPDTLPPAMVN